MLTNLAHSLRMFLAGMLTMLGIVIAVYFHTHTVTYSSVATNQSQQQVIAQATSESMAALLPPVKPVQVKK